MKRLLLAMGILLPAIATAAPRNIIIDTDAGSDDMIAIAFLLSRPDVHIEAITVVNGIAHVQPGARNILRLLELAGKVDVPVYLGREAPLNGSNAFPDSWRVTADSLPAAGLPEVQRKPEAETAAEYLAKRLKITTRPVSILAIGPLTNIAEAVAALPRGAYPVDDMVVMGGAVRVNGNLVGDTLLADNVTAEWNIYIDPGAARTVFQSGLRFRLVPLDACNKVPFYSAFVTEFAKRAKTPLGKYVAELLESNRTLIDAHMFYAWDPLAAVALINPAVLKISSIPIEILDQAPEAGRTREDPKARSMVRVALDAEPLSFNKTFLDTFGAGAKVRLGDIEFFGHKGLDVAALRKSLPVHSGDEYTDGTKSLVSKAIVASIGKEPTSVNPVCCDEEGKTLLFIGLPGASYKPFVYNPEPKGADRLPPEIVDLASRLDTAIFAAVEKGGDAATEDDSNGYALINDSAARALQLELRRWALNQEAELLRVLESSSDVKDRRIAGDALGYARKSKGQILALVRAARDQDDDVRNNATRALGVLVRSDPTLSREIPPETFIEMMNSGTWSDRNKSSMALAELTAARDPALLSGVREKALDSLIEMASWRRSSHAFSARMILGRMAGIPEERLQVLAWDGPVETIIQAVRAR